MAFEVRDHVSFSGDGHGADHTVIMSHVSHRLVRAEARLQVPTGQVTDAHPLTFKLHVDLPVQVLQVPPQFVAVAGFKLLVGTERTGLPAGSVQVHQRLQSFQFALDRDVPL